MMEEPSVLDYLKAKLTPWRGPAPRIPWDGPEESVSPAAEIAASPVESSLPGPVLASVSAAPAPIPAVETAPPQASPQAPAQVQAGNIPWRSLIAVGLALIAQLTLESGPGHSALPGIATYLLAFFWLGYAAWEGEWKTIPLPESQRRLDRLAVNWIALLIGLSLALIAFYLFGGDRFTLTNVFFWVCALALIMHGFWVSTPGPSMWDRLLAWARHPHLEIKISAWAVLVLAAAVLVIFFRVYHLNQVPPEMISDHAEKLLDVGDVLNGKTSIFFPRNTGREAIQFYLTAAIILIFHTGLSFLSLKIGTTIMGLLTLPFIYLLGKELGNRRIGFLAAVLAGIAYWPNVITRVALRFTLYPAFVAPTLYFLIRGLRRSSRNDFILAGLFLGLGLQGYTPFRIVPFVVVAAVGLYLLHRAANGQRLQTVWRLGVLAFVSLIVFLPLLRYALSNPEMFAFRAFSRLGSIEQPLPGPAWQIFLSNTWHAITMFSWNDGEIWPVSVTNRPALDVVSGALFMLGIGILLFRYLRRRDWRDLFLVLSVPMLLLPSILSLAFPNENPALNRTAGAIIPVFIIAAIALDGLLSAVQNHLGSTAGRNAALALGIGLIFLSASQNYDLVFHQYQRAYELSSWNTSEMGQVIASYAQSVGSLDSAWVVAYPYWVDTRLVGMNAGNPFRDYAIATNQLATTTPVPGPKLFLVNLEDHNAIAELKTLYPAGWLHEYASKVPDKDFYLFFVPPEPAQP